MDGAVHITEAKSVPELMPFQKEAVIKMQKFLHERKCCYNAAEQGLGKCAMALRTIKEMKLSTILIICPAVMRLTWEEEIRKWDSPIVDVLPVLSSKDFNKAKEAIGHGGYVIVSYTLAAQKKFTEALASVTWDMLVLDEAFYVKSTRALRTKAIMKSIWPACTYKIALAGTPMTQSVLDVWPVFSRMAPEAFHDWHAFVNRYAYVRMTPWGPKYYGIKNNEELSRTIRAKFFIRYRKDEVLRELPDKTFERITLDTGYAVKVPRSEEEVLAASVQNVLTKIQNGNGVGVVPTCLAQERRLQGEKKVPAVVEFVKDLLEQEIPVVCFGWHKSVMAELEKALKEYKPSIIVGETPADKRFNMVKRFQDGETDLFLGNMAAAGVGITLTRSSTVVLAELDWSPAIVSQAVDRTHRISQKDAVTIYYFVAKDSIDEKLVNAIMSKVAVFNKVIDGQ